MHGFFSAALYSKQKKVKNVLKCAEAVKKTVIDLLKPIKEQVKTITADNGTAFSKHKKICVKLEINIGACLSN